VQLRPDSAGQLAGHPGAFLTRGTSARRRPDSRSGSRARARTASVDFRVGSLTLAGWTGPFRGGPPRVFAPLTSAGHRRAEPPDGWPGGGPAGQVTVRYPAAPTARPGRHPQRTALAI
jgi:hypothetical protein